MYVYGADEFPDMLTLMLPSDKPLHDGKVLFIDEIIVPGQQGVRLEL